MSESTALVPTITDGDIDSIRKRGAIQKAYAKEVNTVFRQIEGMSWGAGSSLVKGDQFSPQTRHALATFCVITKANPMLHVDMLGGKPYLNANYWVDLLNNHEYFHHYEQRDLSPDTETHLRERASGWREAAEMLEDGPEKGRYLAKAMEAEAEADTIAIDRQNWGARPTATHVVETTIFRFINAAPMAQIKAGKILDLTPFLVEVKECNWAGGMGSTMAHAKKYDPIGDANPGHTARTRSLRRCANKAFSAWMQQYANQLERAEQAMEAEFEIIVEQNGHEMEALPQPGEPQGVSFHNGEAEAVNAKDAKSLPKKGKPLAEVFAEEVEAPYQEASRVNEHVITPEGYEEVERPPETKAKHDPSGEINEKQQADFDYREQTKRLFATMNSAGIPDSERKPWAKKHGLAQSTKNWTLADFDRAVDILMAPWVKQVEEGCKAIGVEISDLSLQVIQKEVPEYLKDYQALASAINDRLEGADL